MVNVNGYTYKCQWTIERYQIQNYKNRKRQIVNFNVDIAHTIN